MKFFPLASLAALLTLGLTACDDDNGSATPQKPAIFLHNVTDAGQLYLDGPDRPYGRVDFGTFGNGPVLDVKTWALEVKDVNDNDSADEDTLLDTTFAVADIDAANLYALVGKQDNIQLVSFTSGYDKESDAVTNDSSADDSAIYINLAHMHPALGALSLYVVKEGDDVDAAAAVSTLAFGETSEDLKLKSSKQQLIVKDAEGVIVFDSGVKELKDALTQSLIIAESVADEEKLKVFYFYGSSTNSEDWGSNDGQAEVRIFNALYESSLNSVTTTNPNDQSAVDLLAAVEGALPYKSVSEYVTLPVGQYDFAANVVDSDALTPSHFLNDGMKETIILAGKLGEGETWSTLRLTDEGQALSTRAKVTLVHLGYQTDEDDYKPLDVHLVSNGVDLATRTPEAEGINYLEVQSIEKSINSETLNLTLRVMDETSTKTIAAMDLTLAAGDNLQVALVPREGLSFELVKIN
ncbi:MAG: hypothetical protein OXE99_02365 [Cellvibrionales bacterium]|nr:hypothetical protein [Cellvibrionales bacterium]